MDGQVIAELHCLNCARHLADLLLGPGRRARLDYPGGHDTRPILVIVTLSGPRCARCGGRVLVERPLHTDATRRRVNCAA